ncbi:MAG: CBS domain-containing protein [Egibacteraceae bacterium]
MVVPPLNRPDPLPGLQRVRKALTSRVRAESVMLGLGAATGLATGLLAALLIAVIDLVRRLAWGVQTSVLEVLLVPALGAFMVGLLITYWLPEASGSGLTGDSGLVLPLMLSVGLATFVADRIQPESLYTFGLRKRGIVYAEPEDIDVMQTVSVGEIMSPPEHVPADLPLHTLVEQFRQSRHHGYPVLEGDRLVGVVTLSDLGRPDPDALDPALTAGQLCTRPPVTVTPRDPMFRAVRRMATLDVGRLPVVASDDHSRLVGIRRADVVQAYRRALSRSLGVQQQGTSSRLKDLWGTQPAELVVDAGAPVAGQHIRDVTWPSRTLLTSIRRDGQMLTPVGDTQLLAGDEVVVLTAREATQDLRALLAAPDDEQGL